MAQVRTDQGRRYTVCLGPADQIDNIDLDRGDEISLRGKSFPIDGQRFLLNGPPQDPGPPMTVVLNWTAALKK